MADATKVPSLRVSRIKPQRVSDVGYADQRGDGYGDAYVIQQSLNRMAGEGSIFVSRNATQGTGVTVTNNVTAAAGSLAPFIFGTLPTTALASVHLLSLWVKFVGIGSGWVLGNLDCVVSTAPTRTSAGTDYNAKASGIATAGYHNARSDSPFASALSALWAGAPVTVLGSDPWQAMRWPFRTLTIPVAGDELYVNFGGYGGGRVDAHAGLALYADTTVAARFTKTAPPVVVEPGAGFEFFIWGASMAGTVSVEWELIWQER